MAGEDEKSTRDLLGKYLDILATDPEEYARKTVKLCFPYVSKSLLVTVLQKAKLAFEKDTMVIQLAPPFIACGDLHGHFLDLLRILRYGKTPPEGGRYLFLGDFIDRGDFSMETIILIFLMKIHYPDNIFAIRGNHEFFEVCRRSTFSCELVSYYGEDVIPSFLEVFSYMSVSAVVNNFAVFFHGGIGPSFSSIDQINSINKPIHDFSNKILADIVWSDPTDAVDDFSNSTRGIGSLFGKKVVKDFLNNNNFQILVRGHQTLMSGYAFSQDNKVLTLYSASNECGVNNNNAGIAIFTETNGIEFAVFEPLPHLSRGEAKFMYCDANGKTSHRTLLDFGSIGDQPAKKILTPFIRNKSISGKNILDKINSNKQITRVVLRRQKSVLADSFVRRKSSSPK